MLKVAAVVPPASKNLGNDFFSLGGIEAFKQTYAHVEKEIHYIEFFDSGEKGFGHGRTAFFTQATLDWIRDEADVVVLFGGCCLHNNLRHLFEPLLATGTPFIGWGLSPTTYDQNDVNFAKEIADKSFALITRDDIIAKNVGEYNNFMSGMDGGWWMGDSYTKPSKTSEYLLVNIEKGGVLDRGESGKAYNTLKAQTKSPVHIISNNCERGDHFNDSRCFLITSAKHLYTTISNSTFIVTTRAHSTICALTNGVEVEYLGIRDCRVDGLMATVGVNLSDELDAAEVVDKVKNAKAKFIADVADRFDITKLIK